MITRPFHYRLITGSFLSLLGLGFLTGCTNPSSQEAPYAPVCPRVNVPEATADLYLFDGKGIDISHTAYHAQIMAVNGDCRTGPRDDRKRPLTRVRVGLSIQFTEGAVADQKSLDVPYFIAIIKDGKIIDKQIFTEKFRPHAALGMTQTHSTLRFIDLPTGSDPQQTPYDLEIGFQLTHGQLDYNRSHLRAVTFEKVGR